MSYNSKIVSTHASNCGVDLVRQCMKCVIVIKKETHGVSVYDPRLQQEGVLIDKQHTTCMRLHQSQCRCAEYQKAYVKHELDLINHISPDVLGSNNKRHSRTRSRDSNRYQP